MTTRYLLEGKAALVTGSARGIGLACATELSRAGASVVLLDRLGDTARASARALIDEGGRAVAIEGDVCQTATLPQLVAQAEATFGRLDILVNNVGMTLETQTESITSAEWDLVMEVNLKTVFFMTQATLPALSRQGGGVVVNVSSIVARSGGVNSTMDYAASKGGVLSLTRALARELGPRGIRVNAVTPGPIMTEMIQHWSKEKLDDLVARTPVRRLGTPVDVAHSVVFLASPWADYLTGVAIDVAGGLYMS
jgi:3-oxoacyl-[acyl-carrier protein] reductase